MKARLLLFLLLFCFVCYPCNGTASIEVPAVVGDGSGLVNISVRLIPGEADVFLSTYPQTGTSTQVSVEDAAAYSFSKAGVSGCDAVFKIDATSASAGYVDGPSAGAALAVVAYAALNGTMPRSDALMSGTIDMFGVVGPVGGLYEKSMAAYANDADYFLIPKSGYLDLLLLQNVEERYGLTILEMEDAEDAIGFMLFNQSLDEPTFERMPDKIPDLPQYDESGMQGFMNVSLDMVLALNRTVQGLPQTDEEARAIREYYLHEIDNEHTLLQRGYLFTGANNAFLYYIEVSTISAVFSDDVDLEEKKQETQSCLLALPEKQKTDSNFEWLVGADLRRSWAAQRLNTTDIESPGLLEEKYLAFNDLMYADAWCIVSGSLRAAAPEGGQAIDESAWKDLAKEKLDIALSLEDVLPSEQEHLDSAQAAFLEGRYGAAIFDSVYVIEMVQADLDMFNMSSEEIGKEADDILDEGRTSLWGSVYQSQGAYLLQVNATGSAFSILRYAKGLDEAVAQMEAGAAPAQDSAQPTDPQTIVIMLLIFIIITMLLFYISIWMDKRGLHGQRRAKGRRKIS